MYRAGIVTLSDKGAAGEREDVSGAVIREILENAGFEVVSYKLLADEGEDLKEELMRLSDEVECDLVLTTGGTGFSPRDVTPEPLWLLRTAMHRELPRPYGLTA